MPTVKTATPRVGSHPVTMPGRGTPKITLRVPEPLWRTFGEVAGRAGVDRATLLREFIRWYIREREAKPPRRP